MISILLAIPAWVGLVYGLNTCSKNSAHRFKKPIQWAHALTFELFTMLILSFWRATSRSKDVPTGNARPILLIHGYFNGAYVWKFHQKRLEKAGLGPVYTLDLGHPFQSIHNYVQRVQEKAKQIEMETGKSQLTLIGHSMGGLVGALYASTLAPKGSIAKIITLASPFGGTLMAFLGIGRSAKEMRLGSTFLQELQDALGKRPDLEFYHIATKTDEIVVPYSSSLIGSRQEKRLILEDVGHASLLLSSRVSRKLCDLA